VPSKSAPENCSKTVINPQRHFTAEQAHQLGLLDKTVESIQDERLLSATFSPSKSSQDSPPHDDVTPNQTPFSPNKSSQDSPPHDDVTPNQTPFSPNKSSQDSPPHDDVTPNQTPFSPNPPTNSTPTRRRPRKQRTPSKAVDSQNSPPHDNDTLDNPRTYSTPTRRKPRKQQTPSKSPSNAMGSQDFQPLDDDTLSMDGLGIVPPTPPSRRPLFRVSTPASSFKSMHFDSTLSSIEFVCSDSDGENPDLGSEYSGSDAGFETTDDENDATIMYSPPRSPLGVEQSPTHSPLRNEQANTTNVADVSGHGNYISERRIADCPLDVILDEDVHAGWEQINDDDGLAGADLMPYLGDQPKLNIRPEEDTPLGYFKLFFPESFWEQMCRETNIYARLTISEYNNSFYYQQIVQIIVVNELYKLIKISV